MVFIVCLFILLIFPNSSYIFLKIFDSLIEFHGCELDSSKGVILTVQWIKSIVKNTAKNEIDKNTQNFCQKHSGCIFDSGKSGSIPNLLFFSHLSYC